MITLSPIRKFTSRAGDRDAIFSTGYLKNNLSSRAARGGLVVFASQMLKFVMQTGSQMVLARLLTPADFGLIAMVAVFSGFMQLFQDMGLSMATVQRKEITHRQVSCVFWVNVGASVFLAALFASLSTVLASLYNEPELVGVVLALSSTFVFVGLTAQHMAILRRHMRYRAIAVIDIGSSLLGIATAIVMAIYGFGFWALVAMMIAQGGTRMLMAWAASPWVPGLPRKTEGMGGILKFGGNLTGFNLINYGTRNADNLMLGAIWGAATLGVYAKAYGILLLPLRQINAPISSVAVPSLSRLQDEPERFANFYYKMLQVSAYISMPVIILLIVLSEEAVFILLGPQWGEAVPIFRVLAMLAFGQTVLSSTGWVLTSLDRTNRLFRWSFIQGSCAIASFAIGLQWGGYGVAVAAAICGLTLLLPSLLYAYHGTPIRLRAVLAVLMRPVVLSMLVLAAALPTRMLLMDQWIGLRLGASLAGAGAVVAAAYALWPQLREDAQKVRQSLKKK